MNNFKKLSRHELKAVTGGIPVLNGTYACCIGHECSTTVTVAFADDLSCGAGAQLVRLGPAPVTFTP